MPIDPEIEEALRQPPEPAPHRTGGSARVRSWRPIFDVIAGGTMFVLAFIGIAASDVSTRSQTYWSLIAIVFGLICLGLDWVHEPRGTSWWKAALRTALHWFGVLLAIELVYLMIAAGRLTNADVGLMNGAILALGTFTSGVHTNWRVAVIGAALGLGTAAVGYVEQYLWILFVLALAALGLIIAIARMRGRAA
jgi:hypothetical protein